MDLFRRGEGRKKGKGKKLEERNGEEEVGSAGKDVSLGGRRKEM